MNRPAALHGLVFSQRLPDAPAMDAHLLPSADAHEDVVYAMRRQICAMHYVAFLAVHGAPPQDVEITLLENPESASVHLVATAQSVSNKTSLQWVERFGRGLKSWSQAGFHNPVVCAPVPGKPDLYDWTVGPPALVYENAAANLAKAGRLTELENLAAFLGDQLHPRYHPDSPEYFLRHVRPGPRG